MTSPELTWLTYTVLLTACLWVPYILKLIAQQGLIPALTDPSGARDFDAPWATRALKAHSNAVENLVVFAPVSMMVGLLQLGNALTATVAMVFFFARLAHFVIYVTGIPYLRTISFAVGWACTIIMALRLLNYV